MISDIRVFLCDDDHLRFFGEGPCRLLHLIEETGSLRAAAISMGISESTLMEETAEVSTSGRLRSPRNHCSSSLI